MHVNRHIWDSQWIVTRSRCGYRVVNINIFPNASFIWIILGGLSTKIFLPDAERWDKDNWVRMWDGQHCIHCAYMKALTALHRTQGILLYLGFLTLGWRMEMCFFQRLGILKSISGLGNRYYCPERAIIYLIEVGFF